MVCIGEYCKDCGYLICVENHKEGYEKHGFGYTRYRKAYLCKETDCPVYKYKPSAYWGVPKGLKRKI